MSPGGSSNEIGDTAGVKDVNADRFVPVSMFEEAQLRASAADKKAAHLNSLLGESESENARLSQLAAVLKVKPYISQAIVTVYACVYYIGFMLVLTHKTTTIIFNF